MQQQTKAVRAIVTIAGPSKIPTAAVTGSLVYQLENKMLAIQRGFGVVEPSLRDPSPVALSYSTLIKRRPRKTSWGLLRGYEEETRTTGRARL